MSLAKALMYVPEAQSTMTSKSKVSPETTGSLVLSNLETKTAFGFSSTLLPSRTRS